MKKGALVLCLVLAGCTLPDQSQGIKISDVIQISLTDNSNKVTASVLADSISIVKIVATLGPNVSSDQQVTFVTDQGRFLGADPKNPKTITQMTSLKTVTVTLIADTKPNTNVGISASVTTGSQTFTAPQQIAFVTAYPDNIYITTDKEIVPPDQTSAATLTIHSLQEPASGRVSEGVLIAITPSPALKDSVTVDVVQFVALSKGIATFTVRSTNKLKGHVTINATVKDKTTAATPKIIYFSN